MHCDIQTSGSCCDDIIVLLRILSYGVRLLIANALQHLSRKHQSEALEDKETGVAV